MEKEWKYDGDAVGLLADVMLVLVDRELEKDGIWDTETALGNASAISAAATNYGISYEKVARAMIDAGLAILERIA